MDLSAGTSTRTHVVFDVQRENQKTIEDFIQARKTEANIAITTQKVTLDNLKRFSRFVNKDFNNINRADIISFLNTMRKSENQDPNHKWIGTYNLFVVTLGTFFKWFSNPNVDPKLREKPHILNSIRQLKRKEKSAYKPTDM